MSPLCSFRFVSSPAFLGDYFRHPLLSLPIPLPSSSADDLPFYPTEEAEAIRRDLPAGPHPLPLLKGIAPARFQSGSSWPLRNISRACCCSDHLKTQKKKKKMLLTPHLPLSATPLSLLPCIVNPSKTTIYTHCLHFFLSPPLLHPLQRPTPPRALETAAVQATGDLHGARRTAWSSGLVFISWLVQCWPQPIAPGLAVQTSLTGASAPASLADPYCLPSPLDIGGLGLKHLLMAAGGD